MTVILPQFHHCDYGMCEWLNFGTFFKFPCIVRIYAWFFMHCRNHHSDSHANHVIMEIYPYLRWQLYHCRIYFIYRNNGHLQKYWYIFASRFSLMSWQLLNWSKRSWRSCYRLLYIVILLEYDACRCSYYRTFTSNDIWNSIAIGKTRYSGNNICLGTISVPWHGIHVYLLIRAHNERHVLDGYWFCNDGEYRSEWNQSGIKKKCHVYGLKKKSLRFIESYH